MRFTPLRSMVTTLATIVASFVLITAPPTRADPVRVEPTNDAVAQRAAEQHAKKDLVGLSMTDIEARSAGPDAAPAAPTPPPASARGAVGEWSAVMPTEVVPVFTAVLPNGKVLMWDSVGDNPTESYETHASTRALVWDPATDTQVRHDVVGYNIFCSGYVQLPDGDVLVVGGNKDRYLNGIRQTHLFDWQTETWSRGPDMAGERWYPSVAALGTGEALILGGGPTTAEVYQSDGSLRSLTGFQTQSSRSYPFLVPRGDGGVEAVGPAPSLDRYDTAGAGSSTRTVAREYGNDTEIRRSAGSFVTYDLDKTLVAGGGPVSYNPNQAVSSPTAFRVDTSIAGQSKVLPAAPMSVGRRQHNLTVLPDGSVLATGGSSSTTEDLVDLNAAVRVAERWDPVTDTWTRLSEAARVRQYHSTAILLPDGRVLTGGGGICSTCAQVNYLEKNIEYFSPPYLFAKDGSPAPRPKVGQVPSTMGYASSISFTASVPITKVALIRLGANTHSVDQGQRYVPLTFRQFGTTITATTPRDGNDAPPGHYMLFVLDAAGVPSVAPILRVGPGLDQTPAPVQITPTSGAAPAPVLIGPPVSNPPAAPARPRCLQGHGAGSRTRAVVRANCVGDTAQVWKLRAATLRPVSARNRCLTFGRGLVRRGTPVLLADCAGGPRQQTVTVKRTIRPAIARGLCVSSTGRALQAGDNLVLRPCRGTEAQRWDWRRARG